MNRLCVVLAAGILLSSGFVVFAVPTAPAEGETNSSSRAATNRVFHFFLSTNANLHASTEPYTINKTYEAGLRDLKALCATTKHEVAFLYSPRRSRWINLSESYREGRDAISHRVVTVIERPLRYRDVDTEVFHVHIHPRFVTEDPAFQQNHIGEIQRRVSDAILPIPSPQDVDYYLYNKVRQRDVKINYVIVSEHGVTEVTLDMSDPAETNREYAEVWANLTSSTLLVTLSGGRSAHQRVVAIINESQKAVFLKFTPWSLWRGEEKGKKPS